MRMKRLSLLLALLLLLTSCKAGGTQEPATAQPTSSLPPSPTVTPSPDPDAPLWAALTLEELPSQLADPAQMPAVSSPQAFLLGCQLDEEIYLYGLNAGYGGGVLLRHGETLTHFEQVFSTVEHAVLPELWWGDFNGDGEDELGVRYLVSVEGDAIVYDLHLYTWMEDTWSDCPVTRDNCAELFLQEVEQDYDARTGTLTLSYGVTSAVYQFPKAVDSPGHLTMGYSCFFREQSGIFTVVLGVRVDQTGAHMANVVADIVPEGDGFTFRNIRVEPTMGV